MRDGVSECQKKRGVSGDNSLFFAAFFFLLWVLKVFISPIPSQAWYVATQVWPSPESGFPGFRVYTLEVVYPENSPSEKSTIILFLQKKSDCCNWLRHWGEFREGKILSPLVKWKAARRTLFPCYCIGPSIAEQEDWFHWKGGNLECQGPHPWGEGGFRTNNKPGCCFFRFEIEKNPFSQTFHTISVPGVPGKRISRDRGDFQRCWGASCWSLQRDTVRHVVS